MAASHKQMNWSPVSYTPAGGSAITFTGVDNVVPNGGASFVRYSGDADRFATTVVNDYNEPSIAVTTRDIIALLSITPGSRGAVAATWKDAKGQTGGNIQFALANAVPGSPDMGGPHRQLGQGTVTFWAESADGVTSPLSYALA